MSPNVSLPKILPVFPLTGVLLLPGMPIPLNIFEPRYLKMMEDVLKDGMHIGMIQPFTPRDDNKDPTAAKNSAMETPQSFFDIPDLYEIGCAGRVEKSKQTDDGKYLISLRGISRFRISEELEPQDGYRKVVPDYTPFIQDLTPHDPVDPSPLLVAFKKFANASGKDLDITELSNMEGSTLLNALAMALPFAPMEKQALLEAENPSSRAEVLLTLLQMGLQTASTPLQS